MQVWQMRKEKGESIVEYELTDEETDRVLKRGWLKHPSAKYSDRHTFAGKAVAEAQRKKLLKWLHDKGFVVVLDDGNIVMEEFRLEGEVWQGLLKAHEVES